MDNLKVNLKIEDQKDAKILWQDDEFLFVHTEFKSSLNYYMIHKQTRNATHFHGLVLKHRQEIDWMVNEFGFVPGGIEYHHPKNVRYGFYTKNCSATGGDCWCDGSALAASDRYPHFNPESDDDVEDVRTHLLWLLRKELE